MPKEPVEIHILHCGQGDTILLNLLGEKWVLVDCNLPKGKARERFFQFVSSNDIRNLDLVCLTHAHEDHYTGMGAVVEYFTSDDRSIGLFCDPGIEPKLISSLLRKRYRPKSVIREFDDLYLRLDQHLKSYTIKYMRVDQNTSGIRIGPASAHMQLLPVGPDPLVARDLTIGALSSESFRGDLNRMSVILALVNRGGTRDFDALLAADADGNGFNSALKAIKTKTETDHDPEFDVLKIPHHGSLNSHRNSRAFLCR